MNLNLRPAEECKFDAVSLGEVMLRLDPGEGRIRTARSFRAWEGGGEYNVVRGLRRCFGLKTAVITAFADNEVGMLMEDFILQGGCIAKRICYTGLIISICGICRCGTHDFVSCLFFHFNEIPILTFFSVHEILSLYRCSV